MSLITKNPMIRSRGQRRALKYSILDDEQSEHWCIKLNSMTEFQTISMSEEKYHIEDDDFSQSESFSDKNHCQKSVLIDDESEPESFTLALSPIIPSGLLPKIKLNDISDSNSKIIQYAFDVLNDEKLNTQRGRIIELFGSNPATPINTFSPKDFRTNIINYCSNGESYVTLSKFHQAAKQYEHFQLLQQKVDRIENETMNKKQSCKCCFDEYEINTIDIMGRDIMTELPNKLILKLEATYSNKIGQIEITSKPYNILYIDEENRYDLVKGDILYKINNMNLAGLYTSDVYELVKCIPLPFS
eukprot:276238_1